MAICRQTADFYRLVATKILVWRLGYFLASLSAAEYFRIPRIFRHFTVRKEPSLVVQFFSGRQLFSGVHIKREFNQNQKLARHGKVNNTAQTVSVTQNNQRTPLLTRTMRNFMCCFFKYPSPALRIMSKALTNAVNLKCISLGSSWALQVRCRVVEKNE